MKHPNAKLLIAALALSPPMLAGCLPPGGAYFPATTTAAGGTWTAEPLATAVEPATESQPSAPIPSAIPQPQWHFQQVMLPGIAGRCLDATAPASGSPVQLAVCDGSARQLWAFTSAGDLRTSDGKCLDAQWGSTADGTPLWIWDCNGSPAQQFRLYGAALLGPANKCVAMSSASTSVWAPVILYSCAVAPPPPPPPPPPPVRWSADGDVIRACDFAFSSTAAEHTCLDAVRHYRYQPSNVIRACDFATSNEDYALRCVQSGGQASSDISDTVRACDFATSSDAALATCVATAVWIAGDAPGTIRNCDFATNSDDDLMICLRRASDRR